MREKLNITDDLTDMLITLGDRNPGALIVLAKAVVHVKSPLLFMLIVDDMNLRGEQIWVGYKDYCREDIVEFIDAVENRSKTMVDVINKVCGGNELAVTSGGSFRKHA